MPKQFSPPAMLAYREVKEVLNRHGFYIEAMDGCPYLIPQNGGYEDAESIEEMDVLMAKEWRAAKTQGN